MFEELFEKPSTIERYQAAPLVEPRERYLRQLAESGACRLTLRQIALDQVRLLQILNLSEDEKVTVGQIEATAPEWDDARRYKLGHRPRSTRKSTKRALSKAAPFRRNDELLNFLPKGVIAFPGSGITGNLVDKARQLGIPVLSIMPSSA